MTDYTRNALLRDRFGEPLTRVEQIVEARLIEGRTSKEIADERNVSMNTIKVQRAGVFEKRGVHSVVELIHALFKLERKCS